MRSWTRVIGIDPGFRVTGYGLIDTNGQESRYVASGVIRAVSAGDGMQRLQAIFEGVGTLLAQHEPAEMAVERVFVAKNADSALKLGQARAAAMCTTVGYEIAVSEYAARASLSASPLLPDRSSATAALLRTSALLPNPLPRSSA